MKPAQIVDPEAHLRQHASMTRTLNPTRAGARRRLEAVLVAASTLTVLTLSGCAAGTAIDPEASPDAAAEISLVRFPMPEFDPVPDPAPPLTEAESEAARLADADAQWEALLTTYPNAERPADPFEDYMTCLLYTSPSPRDLSTSRMPSSA